MIVSMNNSSLAANQLPSYIEGLCDIVVNQQRKESDFRALLHCLETIPKECIPFKGKILHHINIHATGNENANQRLLSACFARASLLFRKTPNKSEGALGLWKTSLNGQLGDLEENVNQLYELVGINSNQILGKNISLEGDELESHHELDDEETGFESVINEYLLKASLAAHNICALVSVKTDFDLPIPAFILLKMAAKVGLIRWKDYRKGPNGLIKNYVYSLTHYLVDINLMLFRSIITTLRSNIIPFTPFINQTLSRLLEWTRSSNLVKKDANIYHSMRSQLFQMYSFMLEQLSLNVNFEPNLLSTLVEVELLDNLEELLSGVCEDNSDVLVRDRHAADALSCLENLLITYADFLEVQVECKVKTYVIQTCIKIYRDFGSNVINSTCRRCLLQLLQTIANQPYATSTTEISHHIFELADKLETDTALRSISRRALKLGLAHRPTIVVHHEVYNCYGHPMMAAGETTTASQAVQNDTQMTVSEPGTVPSETGEPLQLVATSSKFPGEEGSPAKATKRLRLAEVAATNGGESVPVAEEPTPSEVLREESAPTKETAPLTTAADQASGSAELEEETRGVASSLKKKKEVQAREKNDDDGDDSEIQSYMSYFVEKLA